jgi:PKD repeat protein
MRFVLLAGLCLSVALTGCSGSGSNPVTKPPVANAGGPYTGLPGIAVNFTGSGSTDPQGEVLTYAWSFGDSATGTGASPTHTYAAAGTYTVSLTVTDTSNLTSTATTSVTITAKPPVANAGGPYTGVPDVAVNFNGSGSSDPQGETLTYAWSFGDSTTGTGASPTHTYTAAGTYTVSLTVTDTSNLTSTATTTATLTAQPPVANAGGPYTGLPGVAVSFNGSASTDPQSEALTYAWSFGDSTTGTGATPMHAYTAAGTYTVSLTVTDTSNLTSTATTSATITAQPPVANAGGPYTGLPGVAVNFNGSGSTDPQGEALTYAWSFGDSTTGTGATPMHTYTAAGTYTVSLTVADTSSLTSTATTSATISAPGPVIGGIVMSGNQAISGSHVYLFAANTSGYGMPSLSLLSASDTGFSDDVGAYVLTGSNGNFSVPANYPCPAGDQIYLYALGGTIGTSANSAAGLLAALGPCGNLNVGASVTVNEVTTIAAAYALAGFAADATHVSSSGTPLAQTDLANAFLNATNLASISTGAALSATPSGTGTVPQATINTLADILNACVSSSGPASTPCTTLFANAESSGPTDTATAAINIAHNPGANIAALYGIPDPTVPFTPTLSAMPNDFTIALTFTGGGFGLTQSVAIDAAGNAWITNQGYVSSTPGGATTHYSVGSVTVLSSSGAVLSGTTGYTANGIFAPHGVSIDDSGNAWITDIYVVELSNSGSPLSGTFPYGTAGGFVSDNFYDCEPWAVANDATGNAWISVIGAGCSSITEFSSSGAVLSGDGGFFNTSMDQPVALAIDGSGNAWTVNSGYPSILQETSSSGVVSNGPIYGSVYYPEGLAIDGSGNIWICGVSGNSVSSIERFSNSSSISADYTGGGLASPVGLALDGAGNVWVANGPDPYEGPPVGSVSEFTNSGIPITGSGGYNGGHLVEFPTSIAIDGSGDVWVTNGSSAYWDDGYNDIITELIGVAVPVITPIAAGLPKTPTTNGSSNLGTRP